MGIFGFLKKPKAGTTEAGMELPPVPTIEGAEGFPEMNTQDTPSLQDNSLPPLPTDVPGAVPPKPEAQELDTPKMELPATPEMMPQATPEKVVPEMPPVPDMPPAPDAQPIPEAIPEMPAIPVAPQEGAPIPPPPMEAAGTAAQPSPQAEGAVPTVPAMPPTEMPEMPPQSEFPAVPEMPAHDAIPDTIPPLEDLPEAPTYVPPTSKEELDTTLDNLEAEPEGLPPMRLDEEMPSSADTTETPIKKMRKVLRGPAYLKTESFKAILNDIEKIGTRAGEVDEMLFRLNDFKNGQDQCLEDFKQTIEDVQRKLLFIDKLLFDTNR